MVADHRGRLAASSHDSPTHAQHPLSGHPGVSSAGAPREAKRSESRPGDPGREAAPPGLVTSAITVRETDPSVSALIADLFQPRFPSRDMLASAAAWVPRIEPWRGQEGPRHRLVIAPGVLAVEARDYARHARRLERVEATRRVAVTQQAVQELTWVEGRHPDGGLRETVMVRPGRPCAYSESPHFDEPAEPAVPDEERRASRGSITGWSAKSRARMVRTLAELDYQPMLVDGVPAMTTLTLPGDWVTVAPDARTFKALVARFRKRYARAWGGPLNGVWKLEFQRRGAPHLHIFHVPPTGSAAAFRDGPELRYKAWLSQTWADVVAHPDPTERANHLRAGTGVDYREGIRASDPRRLAIYFSKHGQFAAKEYQNEGPAEWAEGGIGRVWGYWGLEKAREIVEVSPDDALAAVRLLRRWNAAQRPITSMEVWRARVDRRTGEVRYRRRKVRRRIKRLRGSAGFLTVNDGANMAAYVGRYLSLRC